MASRPSIRFAKRTGPGGPGGEDNLLDEAARANLSARETLALLLEREIARKDHRRIDMALKLAHFPVAKDLAGFDYDAQPSVDPKQIRDLAAGRWIANGENLLLLGPPGQKTRSRPKNQEGARLTSPSPWAGKRSSPATPCSSSPP